MACISFSLLFVCLFSPIAFKVLFFILNNFIFTRHGFLCTHIGAVEHHEFVDLCLSSAREYGLSNTSYASLPFFFLILFFSLLYYRYFLSICLPIHSSSSLSNLLSNPSIVCFLSVILFLSFIISNEFFIDSRLHSKIYIFDTFSFIFKNINHGYNTF